MGFIIKCCLYFSCNNFLINEYSYGIFTNSLLSTMSPCSKQSYPAIALSYTLNWRIIATGAMLKGIVPTASTALHSLLKSQVSFRPYSGFIFLAPRSLSATFPTSTHHGRPSTMQSSPSALRVSSSGLYFSAVAAHPGASATIVRRFGCSPRLARLRRTPCRRRIDHRHCSRVSKHNRTPLSLYSTVSPPPPPPRPTPRPFDSRSELDRQRTLISTNHQMILISTAQQKRRHKNFSLIEKWLQGVQTVADCEQVVHNSRGVWGQTSNGVDTAREARSSIELRTLHLGGSGSQLYVVATQKELMRIGSPSCQCYVMSNCQIFMKSIPARPTQRKNAADVSVTMVTGLHNFHSSVEHMAPEIGVGRCDSHNQNNCRGHSRRRTRNC